MYVGYLVESFDPAIGRKYIKILPLMSGYREAVTHKVNFTTFYDDLYGPEGSTEKTLPLPDLEHLTAEDFIIVLAAERIVSYRKFDVAAYGKFQQNTPAIAVPTAAPVVAPAVATETVTPAAPDPAAPDPKRDGL